MTSPRPLTDVVLDVADHIFKTAALLEEVTSGLRAALVAQRVVESSQDTREKTEAILRLATAAKTLGDSMLLLQALTSATMRTTAALGRAGLVDREAVEQKLLSVGRELAERIEIKLSPEQVQ